jgi:hypothetical protein
MPDVLSAQRSRLSALGYELPGENRHNGAEIGQQLKQPLAIDRIVSAGGRDGRPYHAERRRGDSKLGVDGGLWG